jgi:hypothetical protein
MVQQKLFSTISSSSNFFAFLNHTIFGQTQIGVTVSLMTEVRFMQLGI